MRKLNENFMAELFKWVFIDMNIAKMVAGHVTYQLIPKEWVGYKFILKESVEQFINNEKVPSLGAIAQKYSRNDQVQEAISSIKKANLVDKEILITQLERFVKETEFELLSKKVHDLYEEGKREEAIEVNAEESKRILEISLRKTGDKFVQVFGDFKQRCADRKANHDESKVNQKVPFGIDVIDQVTQGGMEFGDIILWIARSGVGKSTSLKWQAYSAAFEGFSVLHIQLEGGVKACVDKYDQIWTRESLSNIKLGKVYEGNKKQWETIKRTLDMVDLLKNDIDVYGFEKFGQASMTEVRNICIEYDKVYGHFPHVLVIDSLDLLITGFNKKIDFDPDYTKFRLQKCSQLFKDLCVEFNMVGITATQTSDVPIEIWNNEQKFIDRSYTEGDKTLVKPYSFVFTVNMTIQEKENGTCRIYIDKLRDYKESQKAFYMATDYDTGCFYDRKRTRQLFFKDGKAMMMTNVSPEGDKKPRMLKASIPKKKSVDEESKPQAKKV